MSMQKYDLHVYTIHTTDTEILLDFCSLQGIILVAIFDDIRSKIIRKLMILISRSGSKAGAESKWQRVSPPINTRTECTGALFLAM